MLCIMKELGVAAVIKSMTVSARTINSDEIAGCSQKHAHTTEDIYE